MHNIVFGVCFFPSLNQLIIDSVLWICKSIFFFFFNVLYMYIILWCPDDMYRLQMTFLKNKYLFLLLCCLEERLFVHLFCSPVPLPSLPPAASAPHHRKYSPGGNLRREKMKKKGGNPANLGRNRLMRTSPEDARGRCVSPRRVVPRGSKKRRK